MKQTAKFKLSQWDAADRILMQDFNADNLKIETALAAHAAALTARGNCRMETFTYTGTGKCGVDNPTRINFSAVFSPIPGTPGILSEESPINALTSINSLGVTWYFSFTSWAR